VGAGCLCSSSYSRTSVNEQGQDPVVQQAGNDEVTGEKIPFADVKSFSPKEQGMSTGLRVGLGAAAGAGSLILTLSLIVPVYSD
jgi:hypothetical protein